MNDKIQENLKILEELTEIITYICREQEVPENKLDTSERR